MTHILPAKAGSGPRVLWHPSGHRDGTARTGREVKLYHRRLCQADLTMSTFLARTAQLRGKGGGPWSRAASLDWGRPPVRAGRGQHKRHQDIVLIDRGMLVTCFLCVV